jgi:hypothetical protein
MFPFWRRRNRVVDVTVMNGNESPMTLVIEPWADELDVPGQASAKIRFEGPEPVLMEIRSESDRLTVYGWFGSTYGSSSGEPMMSGEIPVPGERR